MWFHCGMPQAKSGKNSTEHQLPYAHSSAKRLCYRNGMHQHTAIVNVERPTKETR